MPVKKEVYQQLLTELTKKKATLVAVSKTKPVEDILELYNLGQRDFGENYVQEMVDKALLLPADIRWHFIGHLQTNKVKQIAPFVQLIQGVDSLKLLEEINKQGRKNNRVMDCLLQVHIAEEETKFGLDEHELSLILKETENPGMAHVRVCGLMGMASFTGDTNKIKAEFRWLKKIFDDYSSRLSHFTILSIGMSGDYGIALEAGSNMVRIGSLLFGDRTAKLP